MENKQTGITTKLIPIGKDVKRIEVTSKKLKNNSPYLKPYKNDNN